MLYEMRDKFNDEWIQSEQYLLMTIYPIPRREASS